MSRCILVVEDQLDNRLILRDCLGNAGYELLEAENGVEALTMVAGRGTVRNSVCGAIMMKGKRSIIWLSRKTCWTNF